MKKRLSSEELRSLHGEEYVKAFEANRESYQKRLYGIARHLNLSPEMNVVDYGCGNGQWFEFIHDKIATYDGVDFSPEFIRSFEEKLAAGSFRVEPKLFCRDIIEFCGDHPEEYDMAFTLDFSEHLYDEDFTAIYSAIAKSLKPDGSLVLHTPDGNFFLEWMRNHGWMKQRDQHIGVRNARENIRLLKESGFNEITVKHIAHYNVLSHLHPLSKMPFIGPAFGARLLIFAKANES